MKVLVVEDSQKLQKSLQVGLRRLGYTVDIAGDGEEGIAFALHTDYDVIVLDIMLPKKSGLEVLREIRASEQPARVIILSARDQIPDRVSGLQQGADDYLVKPFSFDELHARIQVLVRRKFRQKSHFIELGDLAVDTALHQACQGDMCISLTPKEMTILEYLACNRGRVVSPDTLLNQINDVNTYSGRNTIEVHVSSLRKKLKDHNIPDLVKTKRGFGYYVE